MTEWPTDLTWWQYLIDHVYHYPGVTFLLILALAILVGAFT